MSPSLNDVKQMLCKAEREASAFEPLPNGLCNSCMEEQDRCDCVDHDKVAETVMAYFIKAYDERDRVANETTLAVFDKAMADIDAAVAAHPVAPLGELSTDEIRHEIVAVAHESIKAARNLSRKDIERATRNVRPSSFATLMMTVLVIVASATAFAVGASL